VHTPPEPCRHRVWPETSCTCGTCAAVSHPPEQLPDDEEQSLREEIASWPVHFLTELYLRVPAGEFRLHRPAVTDLGRYAVRRQLLPSGTA
jgi:hypothetical protein